MDKQCMLLSVLMVFNSVAFGEMKLKKTDSVQKVQIGKSSSIKKQSPKKKNIPAHQSPFAITLREHICHKHFLANMMEFRSKQLIQGLADYPLPSIQPTPTSQHKSGKQAAVDEKNRAMAEELQSAWEQGFGQHRRELIDAFKKCIKIRDNQMQDIDKTIWITQIQFLEMQKNCLEFKEKKALPEYSVYENFSSYLEAILKEMQVREL